MRKTGGLVGSYVHALSVCSAVRAVGGKREYNNRDKRSQCEIAYICIICFVFTTDTSDVFITVFTMDHTPAVQVN